MNYFIVDKNNTIINAIVATEDFAAKIGALPAYDTGRIGDVYDYPVVVPTPSELREQAYNTDLIISWNNEMITVTQAAQLWQYYAAEGSDKATELSALIAEAKQTIRDKYPD